MIDRTGRSHGARELMPPDSIDESKPSRHPDAMTERDTGSNKPTAEPTAVAARPTLKEALRGAFASWWGTVPMDRPKESSDELAGDRTDMASMRTLMAADRTLMAWVRTSLSLSSFGFTIYKVLQGFAQAGFHLPHSQTPLVVGLFLTGLGTLAMVMGSVEYAQSLRELRRFMDIKLARPAFIMAMLMGLIGLFLFFSIITKLF
jgi:putative membrane protein